MIEGKCSVNEFSKSFLLMFDVEFLFYFFFLIFFALSRDRFPCLAQSISSSISSCKFQIQTQDNLQFFLFDFFFLFPWISSVADDDARRVSSLRAITSHRAGLSICPRLSNFHENHN